MNTAGDYFFLGLNIIIAIFFIGSYIMYLRKYLEFKRLCKNKDVVIANTDKVNLKIIFNTFLGVLYISFFITLVIIQGFMNAIITRDVGIFSGLLLLISSLNYLNENSEWMFAENHIYILERKETYKYKTISKVKIVENKRNKNLYWIKILFKDKKVKNITLLSKKNRAEEVCEFLNNKGLKIEM